MCGLRGAVGSAVGPLQRCSGCEPRALEQVVRLVATDLNGVECGERCTKV